jgi:Rrf2 family protein
VTTSSRLSTAIHILTLLAFEDGQPVTSDYIAGSVNTNPVVIRRLLRRLAEAGLVQSTPGSAGGSRLAREARAITLRDVYAAVEGGGLFGEHTQQPNPKCPVGREVVHLLGSRFAAAEEAATDALARSTIADLVRGVKNGPRRH